MAQHKGNCLVHYHGNRVVHIRGNSLVHYGGNSTQEEALAGVLNFPATRPDPEWMDKRLRIKGKKYKPEGHKFDCYSGRKGFIDLMLSPEYNQKLENISVYLGHTSVSTSYTHHKDKENLHYRPTTYTEKSKKPKVGG